MIQIDDKKSCMGCTACASICPKNCIRMEEDDEGFQYPVVDTESCVQCGACEKVCPMRNPVREDPVPQKGFLVQHKDETVRLDSSAGGAFTAIAAVIVEKGGVCLALLMMNHSVFIIHM